MLSEHQIRKAVIPVAGLGTRFLPVTKTIPKEMLPIANKPLIQYAVEEAVASGLESVILVIGRGKRALTDYFQRNREWEHLLASRGQQSEAESLRRLSDSIDITTVWQDSPQGLGHAIGCARSQVGDEPFAVILPDALIDAAVPCILQLMRCYVRQPGCVIATREIQPWEVERFGILDVVPALSPSARSDVLRVLSLSERRVPSPGKPHYYGIFGRYILPGSIFRCIEQVSPGMNGEYQLTDALARCCRDIPTYGFRFEGEHFDAGDKIGFLEATLHYALKDEATAVHLRQRFAQETSLAMRTDATLVSSCPT